MTEHRTPPRLPLLVALAAVGVLAAGCGGSGASSSPSANASMDMSSMSPSMSASMSMPASPTTGAGSSSSAELITIKGFAYSGPSSVPAGSTVTVKNDDQVAHTVTADSAGGFDVNVPPGKTATFTAPSKPGAYPYHCTYHGNMHGTLRVG